MEDWIIGALFAGIVIMLLYAFVQINKIKQEIK